MICIFQEVLDTGGYVFSMQFQILWDIYSPGSIRYCRIYLLCIVLILRICILQEVLDTGGSSLDSTRYWRICVLQVVLNTRGYIFSRQYQILEDIYFLQVVLDTGGYIFFPGSTRYWKIYNLQVVLDTGGYIFSR